MDVLNMDKLLFQLYNTISVWCFEHQLIVDVLTAGLIVGGLVYALQRQRRIRRRMLWTWWGMNMTREQREWMIIQRLEDGLLDSLMEMVNDGTINEQRERELMDKLAHGVKFEGLKPRRGGVEGLKRALNKRISHLQLSKKIPIPGPKPGVEIDKSYTPNAPKDELKSRYVK